MALNQTNQLAGAYPEPLRVAVLGFGAEDGFGRFFQTPRPNQRKYSLATSDNVENIDIIIVNYDKPSALAERDTLLASRSRLPVVAVSRGPLAEAPTHHIRGLLFAARVLTVLDKVEIGEQNKTKPEEPKAFAEVAPQPIVTPNAPQPSSKPVTDSVQPPPTVVAATTAPAAMSAADGFRALVVDDSAAIQKSIEINLANIPQITSIDFADTGESAIEKAEAQKYDLIFLDVMMPGIDGYETCTRLRKKPEYKKTPIIMVSGKTSPLDEVKGVMAGCTTYLTKPVQQDAFQKLSIRVLTWLEKQKAT